MGYPSTSRSARIAGIMKRYGDRFLPNDTAPKRNSVFHIYKYFRFIKTGGEVFAVCEFKVFMVKGEDEAVIAEDIVYAKSENGSIILKGILGEPVTVKNASILEVDVGAERLLLAPKGVVDT
jgi:predicted RNA-binding protein